jgi:DNA-binding transcriptional LysR family regulator
MTQPALSRQIRELEDAVGVQLLERETRGSSMTFAGQVLYEEGCGILAMVDRMLAEAKRSLRAMEGQVILGLVPHPMVRLLVPDVLRGCQDLHPHVRILLEDIPTPQQAAALRESRIDIALGHRHRALATPDDELVRDPLVDDTFDSALLPVGHALTRRAELSIQELADIPFAWPPRSFFPAFYDYVMASFEAAGLKPHIEGEYAGLETMWSMVSRGHGWTLGMHSQRAHPPRGVVVVALSDFSLEWGVDVVHRRDESHSAVLCVLDGILRSQQPGAGAAMPRLVRAMESPAPL